MILELLMEMPQWLQTAILTIELIINVYALNEMSS